MTDHYDPRLSIHGTGDPIVFVPGLDGTGQLFHRQVPLVARANRVATYALRETATTMEALVADLRQVVDQVAPPGRRVTVVGESFGGTLAMSYALAEPQRVSALVVLNSFPHFESQVRLHAALYGLHAIPWRVMGALRRLTAFRLHSRHTDRQEIERFMNVTARASRRGYLNRLKILTRYDIRDRLRELVPATLFLASERDHLVPAVAQARYMADRVPGAVVRVLAGHGHICLIAPDLDLGRIIDEWRALAR